MLVLEIYNAQNSDETLWDLGEVVEGEGYEL
jgi:hypothetical protein